ncbi:MAG TPA: type III-B CRISPR module RAMP protein Cmr1 [Nitrospirae bacterium]|nr:type III-B CRISPR module RAMP protein Cmr1 [Nitrospirota bacterium]HDZ02754.1 type III-B CRISPR module RAMP protein Cmr1 [Nitrospirota bacterium]
MEFRLKALTPIWTGGVKRNDNSTLHVTGIKGSIRWWYEALIRGLGCYACDPTASGHCELKPKELDRDKPLTPQIKKQICPVCYMFGCTGWSGKFILQLKEPGTNRPIQSLSSREISFKLHFLEQKKVDPEEQVLLKMILKLIVDYGAIGGKTIFKPSEIKHKNTKLHHRDFGILARDTRSNLPTEKIRTEEIIQYLEKFKKKKEKNEWSNMKYFWFVKGKHIDRLQHNRLVKRDADGNYKESVNEGDVFLGGFISREKSSFDRKTREEYKDKNAASKKIFSFIGTGDENCLIERCFGYIRADGSLDSFIKNLDFSQLPFQENDIIKGYELIKNL